MKQCLADVNLLFALLVPRHVHHDLAEKWYAKLAAREMALCRAVQFGLIRLLCNRKTMGDQSIAPLAAWLIVDELMRDERVDFVAEPANVDSVLPSIIRQVGTSSDWVSDAWLAAFAVASSRRLATLDRDFRRFEGLDLWLLSATA